MSMIIINPGPLTTVQDLGRHGLLSAGFCPSGVMDEPAAVCANTLVGNSPELAVLEMTMAGITAKFTSDAVIALSGADMEASINGQPAPRYTSLAVREGDELACGFAVSGCRGYLAVSGGINVPLVMGSRSTHLKCGLGGFEGRALRKGDKIDFGAVKKRPALGASLECPPIPEGKLNIRVAVGPQSDYFTADALNGFLASEYTVSPHSDRMGIRLEGESVPSINGTDIVSDAIPLGAIQIPDSGKPIILLADRQTIGGYAKPWVVIGADIPLLAQARPGTILRFERVSIRRAARIWKKTFGHGNYKNS